jgi:fermentation-respiration switch protein FrsA (DUF1100 family)
LKYIGRPETAALIFEAWASAHAVKRLKYAESPVSHFPNRLDMTPQPARRRLPWWLRWGMRASLVCGVPYLLITVYLMINEEAMIYFPPPKDDGDWNHPDLKIEDAQFTSADGTKLHGWYVEHPNPKAHVLLCHGNAEHVAYLGDLLRFYRDELQCSALAWDYRGYGKSEGFPGEQGILADGRAAQAWLANRAGVRPQDVVLVGRSLGGGVAVDLAANGGARGLVLERTFTSMPDVAALHFPWLPVRLLMRTQYNSREKIARYHGPLLMTHGTADDVIPYDLGRELFDAAPGKQKNFIDERGRGHNDPHSSEYEQALLAFLAGLPPLAS